MKNKPVTNFTKLLTILLTGLIICFSTAPAQAQFTGCDPTTPFFNVNLTGTTSNFIFSDANRADQCCNASNSDDCIHFIVALDSTTIAVSLNVVAGATPSGSLWYSVDCGAQTNVAVPICISNPNRVIDTFDIVYCKPGGNSNTWSLNAISGPSGFSNSVALGCRDTIRSAGFRAGTITWTSISPGAQGTYNSLLSCTTCPNPVFTPVSATPTSIQYQVCGRSSAAGICGVDSNTIYCDTVTVTVLPRWSNVPDQAICQPTTTSSLGSAPANSAWSFVSGPATPSVNASSGAVTNMTANGTYVFALTRTTGSALCTDTVNIVRSAQPSAGTDQSICAPQTTAALGAAGGGSSWSFVSGPVSASVNASTGDVTGLTAQGNYLFRLAAGSCADTVQVTIKPQPAAPTAGNNGPLCVGATLNLTATTVSGATYSWSGPSAFSSALQNPSINNVTTANAGTYTVTSIINLCPSSPATTTVVINPIPSAPVVSSNTPVCEGDTLKLFATGSGGATYSWTGPGGFVSAVEDPIRLNATLAMDDAPYCATQTVSGCTSLQACTNVVVNSKPVIQSAVGTNPTTCSGSNGSILVCGLTSGVQYSITYTKNGVSQTPVIGNANAGGCVTIPNLTAGTYFTFTATIVSSGCTSNTFPDSTVLTDPTTPATPGISSNSPVCEGDTLKLFATGSGGATYSWTGPGGFVSSAQNPVRPNATLAMDDAAYFVTQTVAGCTSGAASISVVVNSKPVIGSAIGSNPTACGGTNGTITLGGLSNNILYQVSYERNGSPVGPVPISSNGSGQVIITGLNAASYSDFQVEADATGCVSVVFPGPVVLSDPSTPAVPVVSSNTPVCEGDTIKLFATGTGGASFNWTGPVGFVSALEDPIRINAVLAFAGSYCATQTVAGCVSPQACTSVTINAKPVIVGTSSSNPTTCSGSDGCVFLNGLNASTQYSVTYQRNNVSQGPFLLTTNGSGQLAICGLTAGTYDDFSVTLLGCVSSAFGGSVTLTDPTTPAAPAVGSNTPVCAGNTISLTAVGAGGATYSWTGPLLYTSNAQNPSIPNATLGMSGSYCVTQTVNNCTSQQACTPVVVSPLPVANAGPDTSVCDASCIQIGGSPTASGGTPGYTYAWSNGALAAQNPTVCPVSSAVYTVTVTDTRGCSATASALVTVNQRPTADAGNDQSLVACDLTGVNIGGAPTGQGGTPGYTYLWSPTTGIASGAEVSSNPLVSGIGSSQTYTVLVTDNNGCTANDNVFVNVVSGTYSVVIVPNTSVSWCAETGGNITLTAIAIDGTPAYSYAWTGANFIDSLGSGVTANPSVAGTYIYSVVVTDQTGCQTGDTIEVTVLPTPVADAGFFPDTICSGSCVTLGGSPTASGGTPGYTYQWSGGVAQVANPVACPTTGTTYLLTVTDANGCTATDTKLVEVYSLPTADAGPDVNLASCSPSGVQIGGTPVAAGGGGAPYTYSWSPAIGLSSSTVDRPTVTGLTADTTYTVVVTDVNGCTASDQVVVNVINNSPSVSISPSGLTSWCANSGTTINLQAVVSGGTAPFTYSWSGSNITPTNSQIVAVNPQNSGAYNYRVTVTDAGGCTATATIAVTVTPNPLANAGTPSTICAGACDTLGGAPTASGGTAPFTYLWSDGSTTANPIVCPAGTTTYRVTVTDDNGCTATAVTAVTVRPNPVADAGVDKTIQSCSVRAIPIGGFPTATGGCGGPYTYLWSPGGSTLANPTVLPAITTNYSVTITDACGCTATDQVLVTVVENSPTVSITSSNTPEWCAGSGGTTDLTANVTGGVPGYTFEWSGNPPSNPDNTQVVTVNPNTAGSYVYTVTVSDASNCTVTASRTITVNPNPSASAGANDTICSGGCVSIGGGPTASGGTPGYTYSWSNGGGAGSNPNVCPLTSTTYVLTVTDSKSCSATSATTVIVYPNPLANAGPDQTLINCNGDNVTLGGSPTGFGGSGSFSYSWSPSTGLSSTSTANPTVSGITSNTTYCVTVTDNTSGCTATDCITITVINSSLQAQTAASVSYCFGAVPPVNVGGSPTASGGTPPYTFAWSGTPISSSSVPNPSAQPASTTTYCVTVTDANGCSASSCMTITVNPLPLANAGPDTAVCSGLAVRIGGNPTGSGGTGTLTYTWTPGTGLNSSSIANPTSTLSTTTSYCLTVSDANGCSATDCMTVIVNPNPSADAGDDAVVSTCAGDSVLLGGSPAGAGGTAPLTCLWSPSAPLNNPALCNPYYFGITPGIYFDTLTVTDVNGCKATDVVRIIVSPGTLTVDAGADVEICAGNIGSITLGGFDVVLGGEAPYTFAWSSTPSGFSSSAAHPSVTPTVTTTYCLTVTDGNGCTMSDCVTITVNPVPVANAGNDTTVCAGFSIQIGGNPTASGGTPGYTYDWGNAFGLSGNNIANPFASALITTSYCVTVTDAKGCTSSDCITVTVNPNPSADAGPDKSMVGCQGDSVQIGGSPAATGGLFPYTYSWSPISNLFTSISSNPWVKGLASSQAYTLIVTDANGCTAGDVVQVTVNPSNLSANAGNGGSICFGSGISVPLGGIPTATGGSPAYSYAWSSIPASVIASVANPSVSPTVTTTYCVTVTDSKGCTASSCATVTVNPLPVADAGSDTTICAGVAVIVGGANTGSGGTPGYSFSWSPGIGMNSTTLANPTVTITTTSTYCVTVTDSRGCTASSCATVTVRPNPVADAGPDRTMAACDNSCVQIGGSPTGSGGGGILTYSWAPPTGPVLSDSSASNPFVCNLGSDATYTLTVTDQFGCSATDEVFIDVTNSTLSVFAGNDVAFCQGSSVSVTLGSPAVGGTPPYSYDWTSIPPSIIDTIATPVVSPTVTTTYTVVVTDANGCIAQDQVTVTINPRPVIIPLRDLIICEGENALLGNNPTAIGGTGPLTYSWSPGAGLSCSNCANPVANPVVTTTYCVTVTDSLGCSASACQTVTVNPKPNADAGPDRTVILCAGSCVGVGGSPTGSGGSGNFTYQWLPCLPVLSSCITPNPIICGLDSTTTFTVIVTDNVTGCIDSDQVVVTVVQTTLSANAGTDTVYCLNSAACMRLGGGITDITPTATGGTAPYTYQWGPGVLPPVQNPCVSPTVTTTYCVTVTDALGCSAIDCITITVDPFIIINEGPDTLVCNGSTITLGNTPLVSGGTGPFTYSWSAGAFPTDVENPTATVTTNTSYRVTVTDSLRCSAADQINVTLRPSPIADPGPSAILVACTGDSTVLGGSPTATGTQGPYIYQWSPVGLVNPNNVSNPIVGNLGATTTFCVTVTDVFGCTADSCVIINVVPNTLFVRAGADRSLCTGNLTCVTLGETPVVTGGVQPYQYKWFPGPGSLYNPSDSVANPEVCPTSTTTYTLLVTDARNCSASDAVTITVTPSPVASIAGLNAQYCVNATNAVLTGSPPGGLFSGPGITGNIFSPSLAGVGGPYTICYVVTVAGCSDTVCQNVMVNPIPQVSVTGYQPSYCSYEPPVRLIGSPPGGTFNPPLPGDTFNPATATAGNNVITYTYTDLQTGCTNSTTITIIVRPEPSISVIVSSDTVCVGQSVTLTTNYSTDVTNIQYSVCGGNIFASGLNPVTFIPTGVDYCVRVRAVSSNGCIKDTTIFIHVNQNPIAVNDSVATCEDTAIFIAVLDNDTDPENDVLFVACDTASNGSTTVLNNIITYTPAPDFNGVDTIRYCVCNVQCPTQCDTGLVIVSVCPINDPPVAQDIAASTCRDSSVVVTMNNTDVDAGDILTATDLGCATLNGTITNFSVTGFTFTPSAGFVGTQTICVQVCDTSNTCDTATITITVQPCNNPPVAGDDFDQTDLCDYDTLNINVLDNDTDIDNDVLTVDAIVTQPATGQGTATVSGNVVTYYPGTVTGLVSFTYRVCDDGDPVLCDTGTVTINVIDCIMEISTVSDTVCLGAQSSTCLAANVQSTYPWTITNICQPQNGAAVVSSDPTCFNYTPTQGFVGNDTFCVTVCDDRGHCDDTTVVMTILDCLIQAVDEPCDLTETPMNTPVVVDVLDNDIIPAGGDTTVTIECAVENGTVIVNSDNTVTVTPAAGFEGEITFCYQVCVTTGTNIVCDSASVCVTVIDTVCYIPNAFSPNGDGVNDVFKIPCNDKYENATLRIYNRWGVEVWHSNGHYLDDFKGYNMQGTELPDGTYYLIYEFNDAAGNKEAKFLVIHR